MIDAIILAGGSGTRLWPMSRATHPKQFLPLGGNLTMLQSTVKRLDRLNVRSTFTVCNDEHRFFVADQLSEIKKLDSILLEPCAKNTAPAVGSCAFLVKDDPLLLVLAADHLIVDEAAFTSAVEKAAPLAEAGKLVTFGVTPREPNVEYGYIQRGIPYENGFVVKSFAEKPSKERAETYFSSGEYYWNSGIFLFKASTYLKELKKHRPDIYTACEQSAKKSESDFDFIRLSHNEFSKCPSESIDYAIMENTSDGVVVEMDAGWSDLGSWSSLWEKSIKDAQGNASVGDVVLHKVSNSYVRANEKLVSLVGVDDLVVVDTKDALLISHKDHVGDIKQIVEILKSNSRVEWEYHREVFRPWGKYDSVDKGDQYQVKRITVKPGAKLSVQMHHHRAEHWVVVSGMAKVTRGEETFLLSVNESTYIPLGVIHALENPGKVNLELIEVQSGSYLGEDDIVRFEDRYGRVKRV